MDRVFLRARLARLLLVALAVLNGALWEAALVPAMGGVLWTTLTVAFEIVLGCSVLGRAWAEV